ncbi:thioredoxin domain-containing protein [Sphingomonas sp. KR1UV-12]|uniref:Thioredoxin domain-containing protein n=1 Tax=Sphingomonas aurea TaxID=3063994 RepID=A0ABT9EJZ6_9SPHN|nr:thioredoxin domain-containing protein [Sphingomonas sp. KR1UV-12]MDP1027300.1 thioredoxin domain-containing protein [Sphingomonas sp. KR1UV-12]
MKHVLPLSAAILLAACSGSGDGNSSSPAAPVAAVPAPAGQNWTETVTKTEEGYRMGNPNAAIKLVEYGSRTCPVCGAFAREGFQPLTSNYVASGKVSFEFRDYMVHGAPDIALALLGTCGDNPATFFPILEQTYAVQSTFLDKLQALDPATQQALQSQAPAQAVATLADKIGAVEFIKQRGIPEAKARACLADGKKLEAITKPTETATANGTVTGTPTFIINGDTAPGVVTWPQLETALKRAGA